MSVEQFLIWAGVTAAGVAATFFATRSKFNRLAGEYQNLAAAIDDSASHLHAVQAELADSQATLESTRSETWELQELKKNSDALAAEVHQNTELMENLKRELEEASRMNAEKEIELHDLLAKLDLYTRIDEFTDCGLFEMPEYLYETSARFTEEIKNVRESQKQLIRDKNAATYPDDTVVFPDKANNKRILDGQVKLMLTAFNVECDKLIGSVKPSNYGRILERIEQLANNIEKSASTLRCGFNLDYVKLKYEECRLQYQFVLKKRDEQEEQRMIREQIREEQKAIKEYEKALKEAEREERIYREMLDRARAELLDVSQEERLIAEQRIADLEAKLADAEAREERAKSMAEQTRKGHVYVISNIGSFGDNIFKIGLTRRLEPMDRIKELGDASVPFTFDVHAMIYVDDAPALEAALHREFSAMRVNAVNYRKEFFCADLQSIEAAVTRICGTDVEFQRTALAEEYYESCRLRREILEAAEEDDEVLYAQ